LPAVQASKLFRVRVPLIFRIKAHSGARPSAKDPEDAPDSLRQEDGLARVGAAHHEDGPLPKFAQRRVQQRAATAPAKARQRIAAKQRRQFDMAIPVAAGMVKNAVEIRLVRGICG
jgi:hypothetical protein